MTEVSSHIEIRQKDIDGGRTFAVLMILSSLTETSGSQPATVLTIPTG